jgi:hypothetical protein
VNLASVRSLVKNFLEEFSSNDNYCLTLWTGTPRLVCIRTGEQRSRRLAQIFVVPELVGQRITDIAAIGAVHREYERNDLQPVYQNERVPCDEQKPKFKCACWTLVCTGTQSEVCLIVLILSKAK